MLTGRVRFCLLGTMDAPIVIFALAGQRLALPAGAVRECLPLPALRRRPGTPLSVAGTFSLGGVTLPVIDLAILLGLRAPGGENALEQAGLYRPLLHVGDVALLVDRLERVAVPDASMGEAGPDPWQHGCVSQHLVVAGAPVALLDPARLLLEDERARLAVLVREEAARAGDWAQADRTRADRARADAADAG